MFLSLYDFFSILLDEHDDPSFEISFLRLKLSITWLVCPTLLELSYFTFDWLLCDADDYNLRLLADVFRVSIFFSNSFSFSYNFFIYCFPSLFAYFIGSSC
jgi:hypothetical protein